MKPFLRIAGVFAAVVLGIFVLLVAWESFETWRQVALVRNVFELKHPGFDPTEFSAFLAKRFPPGSSSADVKNFLRHHFGVTDRAGEELSAHGRELSYMVDGGPDFPASHNYILLTFVFGPGDRLEEVKVADRSVSL